MPDFSMATIPTSRKHENIPKSRLVEAARAGDFKPRFTWLQPSDLDIEFAFDYLEDRTNVQIARMLGSIAPGETSTVHSSHMGFYLTHKETDRSCLITYQYSSGEFDGKITGPEFAKLVDWLPEVKALAYERSTVSRANARSEGYTSFMDTIPCAPWAGEFGKPGILAERKHMPRFRAYAEVLGVKCKVREVLKRDLLDTYQRSWNYIDTMQPGGIWREIAIRSHRELKEIIDG